MLVPVCMKVGDVLIQNTNGLDQRLVWLTQLVGFQAPASVLGLSHAAVVAETAYGGEPEHAVLWEMFTSGAKMRPMQGYAKQYADSAESVSDHVMCVLRYVGPQREAATKQLQQVMASWSKQAHHFAFAQPLQMAIPAVILRSL